MLSDAEQAQFDATFTGVIDGPKIKAHMDSLPNILTPAQITFLNREKCRAENEDAAKVAMNALHGTLSAHNIGDTDGSMGHVDDYYPSSFQTPMTLSRLSLQQQAAFNSRCREFDQDFRASPEGRVYLNALYGMLSMHGVGDNAGSTGHTAMLTGPDNFDYSDIPPLEIGDSVDYSDMPPLETSDSVDND